MTRKNIPGSSNIPMECNAPVLVSSQQSFRSLTVGRCLPAHGRLLFLAQASNSQRRLAAYTFSRAEPNPPLRFLDYPPAGPFLSTGVPTWASRHFCKLPVLEPRRSARPRLVAGSAARPRPPCHWLGQPGEHLSVSICRLNQALDGSWMALIRLTSVTKFVRLHARLDRASACCVN